MGLKNQISVFFESGRFTKVLLYFLIAPFTDIPMFNSTGQISCNAKKQMYACAAISIHRFR